MKNPAFILALLCAAPLALAQNPPTPTPDPQAPNPPALEKPQMAQPEADDKKSDTPAPKGLKKPAAPTAPEPAGREGAPPPSPGGAKAIFDRVFKKGG